MKRLIALLCILLFYYSVQGQPQIEQHDTLGTVHISYHNPALELIQHASHNRKQNSFRFNHSYQYTKYQKVVAHTDTLPQNLFINENVTRVSFLKPHYSKSTVIASRTSGLDNPLISVWIASLSVCYFDMNLLPIFQTKFLNPMSEKGIDLYDYYLSDTVINQKDTSYIILFSPKKNHQFSSLTGKLVLHHPDFALQYFQADAFDSTAQFPIHFEYWFKPLGNGTWQPDSSYYNIKYVNPLLQNIPILFSSYSKFKEVSVNKPFSPKDFDNIEVQDSLSSQNVNEQLLDTYRSAPLTTMENRDYQLIDSISKKSHLNEEIHLLTTLCEGYYPIGPVNLDIASVVDYNPIEKWRFGLGLYTNNKLTKYATIGGHFAYGIRDHRWKGGGMAEIHISPKYDIALRLSGQYDMIGSGNIYSYAQDVQFLSGEYFRQWLIEHYDYATETRIEYRMRPWSWMQWNIGVTYGRYTTGYVYQYQPLASTNSTNNYFSFHNFEIHSAIRLAFREKHISTGLLQLVEESPYPVIMLHYARGIRNLWNSDFNYDKFDLNIRYRKEYRNLGYSEISLFGGYTPNVLPASLLYVPMGAYAIIDFDNWEQFATMRSNDFLCDRYFFVFFRHNFGKMTENKHFSPQIVFCQNVGFGGLRHPEYHSEINFNTLTKGYYETGIILDHLLNYMKIIHLGIGLFYHYGTYTSLHEWQNFAIKISISA